MENEENQKIGILLRASEVARILKISRTSAYRLMQTELPAILIGERTIRVRESDLVAYANRRTKIVDQI